MVLFIFFYFYGRILHTKNNVEDVRVILVFPMENNFKEYETRFKNRGNTEEFIERRRKEFPSLVKLFENAHDYEKITIKPGQFLSQVLIENGVALKEK